MILLRDLCYRARTIAASMAIGQTEASGGASRRDRSAAEDGGTEFSCFARNDGAAVRGRKLWTAVAPWPIEAQPTFG
ncbi:hypothetical protein AD929_11905 [Gluconobacter potus]|nr:MULTISPECIES: hypothetical protein [Acetobacteraceae]KXV00323.1 hypothetical protein AD929_11905 [Gluconobacter potus]KXV16833.1 hypothetical protein AD933_05525 [Acetobacter malorum]KXV49241.1 hypothetical protein AD945_05090 [Gluconobacter albidus]NHN81853.1 hypothetical protein [Acetobacter lovaniensis]NHN90222.1 hypothetical protein [Acetobacter conturbans]NHO20663.1 hypothetical protein [Acetobacter oeni]NHO32046.1 hypothetical protein [Acetobacter fallax]PYD60529.1 hypothetical pro